MKKTSTLLFFGIFLIFSANVSFATVPEMDVEKTPYEIFLAAEKAAEKIFKDEDDRGSFSDVVFVFINESIEKGYQDKKNLTNLLNRMDAFVIEGKTPYAEWLREESGWYAEFSIRLRFRINNLPD